MKPLSLFSKIAPLSSNESGPHPALIFLHGRGTDENDLLELTPYLDPHFLIASVRAPYRFPHGGYTWFDLDEKGSVNIDQFINSRDSFLQWLDDFQKNNPIDSSKLFLFGFSMGAIMSLTISLSNPKLFKGIVAHSGMLPQDEQLSYQWNDLSNLSFFIAHGSQDPIVPVELGRQAHRRLVQANADVIYHEYPIQHTISDESLSDVSIWLLKQI
jgi:phospholipase/carboxylesterase